jgi:hypothetical protein
METYPKFEKVNDHQIKIICEKAEIAEYDVLVSNIKALEKKIASLQEVLDNTKEILAAADELGIKSVPPQEPGTGTSGTENKDK